MFSRQLEQALVASKNEADSDASSCSTTDTSKANSTADKASQDGEFVPEEEEGSGASDSEEDSYSAVEDDEDSDFSASPEIKKGKKTGKENAKSAQRAKQAKSTKASTSPKTVVKSGAGKSTAKPLSSTNSVVRSTKVKTETLKSSPSVSGAKGVNLPGNRSLSSGGSPAVLGGNRRSVNWTPPARVGENKTASPANVKSTRLSGGGGGTPVIRVGLSRNVQVKSLHANIKT